MKSSLVDHAVYIRHLDSSAANQERVIGRYSGVPLAVYAHQNKVTIMTQKGLKYDHKSAKWQQRRAPAIL